ncbi:ATP-grasp domain-containing protein [Flavobacterium phragmitis]|uniref:Carbamoyl-phosphate synthase large subunit n=1 Tax=Flavobacterium phragmitis TaxID=739143 RepID=A0A1I1UQP8_9FLAO|nr:ATP-grasp domain-containing protein [Flavobacterium phragmitis]SFD73121.1 carbamoyl-phosphate synthase large subunit [Flavobacterium phragmitis]
MNILITSAGQRVSLVRAFKNELKKTFSTGMVYTVDMSPNLSPACQVSDGYKAVKRVDDADYIKELISICKDWKIKLVIPTIDTELIFLSTNKLMFKNEGIEVIVSNEDFIKKCRDKRLINLFFKDHEIDIPKPYDKLNPEFPLFIKPYDGSLSKDIFLINKKDELTEYHFNNEKLMFMEYIDSNLFDEFTIDAYYNRNGELKCAVPRKRIAVRSGEISKGVTCKNFILNYLKDKLPKIDGAVGCLTIQIFYNSNTNRIIGIEINPRFGGGFPLSYLSGANYPLWIIKEYLLDEEITFYNDWEDNLLMLRYDDEILVRNYES